MTSDISIRDARAQHFKQSGLPLDGGYNDSWVPLKFSFLTLYLYNSKARKAAVRLHDIHHVITGYASDPRGEAEISAWELSAGIYNKHFARFINLAGIFYGAYLYPKTTFKAYVRGTYSNSLYQIEFSDSLLDESVEAIRSKLLPKTPTKATLKHYLSYAALVAIASLPALLALIALVFLIQHIG